MMNMMMIRRFLGWWGGGTRSFRGVLGGSWWNSRGALRGSWGAKDDICTMKLLPWTILAPLQMVTWASWWLCLIAARSHRSGRRSEPGKLLQHICHHSTTQHQYLSTFFGLLSIFKVLNIFQGTFHFTGFYHGCLESQDEPPFQQGPLTFNCFCISRIKQ